MVMRFARYMVEKLEGKADADEWTMEMGKQAVVVTFSASKSVASSVECHAGNDGEVDGGIIGEEGAFALDDAVGTFMGGGGRVVEMQFELGTYDCWEKYALGLACLGDEVMGEDFVAQGMIKKHGLGTLEEWMSTEFVNDVCALLA